LGSLLRDLHMAEQAAPRPSLDFPFEHWPAAAAWEPQPHRRLLPNDVNAEDSLGLTGAFDAALSEVDEVFRRLK
jgi:hypothetical protein